MNHPGRRQPDPGATLLDLYDAALPEVYGYPLSRCGRRGLAEDLTAETFLAAVEAVRKQPPRSCRSPGSSGWPVPSSRRGCGNACGARCCNPRETP